MIARTPSQSSDEVRRFLGHSGLAIGPRDRLLIAGILRPETVAVLAPDAIVDPMLPHDAVLVVERGDPDLVLIESAAVTSGPWAHAGDPSVADLAGRLLEVIVAARSLGRPTVLWWNGPRSAAPGLASLEADVSLVVGGDMVPDDDLAAPWTAGVQLARFNTLAIDPERPMRPVHATAWDPAAPRSRRLFAAAALGAIASLDDTANLGLDVWLDRDAGSARLPAWLRPNVTRRIDPMATPEAYRSNGLYLADPLTAARSHGTVDPRVLEQLACGARIVSGPNDALAATISHGMTWIDSPSDASAAVRASIEAGPPGAAERRRVLRELMDRHSTGAALATLARSAGVDRVRARDRGRDTCVIVRLGEDVAASAIVDDIVSQRLRPTEALLRCADPADARIPAAELASAGIAARPVVRTTSGDGLRDLAPLTDARWLWTWSPEGRLDPTRLLDLLAAGAASGADGVGWTEDDEDRLVGSLPIRGSLVVRQAALDRPEPIDGRLAPWAARGARLFSLGAGIAAGDRGAA